MIPFDTVDREYQREEEHPGKHREMKAVLGRIDDPSNISQFPLAVDFSETRHIMICGAAGSGKSTLLFTLLYALSRDYSPAELQYYIFDCSTGILKPFELLPHCGFYIHNGDEADFQRILSFLQETISERRKLFEAAGANTFREFRETDAYKGRALPEIMLVIDSYTKEAVGYETHTTFYKPNWNLVLLPFLSTSFPVCLPCAFMWLTPFFPAILPLYSSLYLLFPFILDLFPASFLPSGRLISSSFFPLTLWKLLLHFTVICKEKDGHAPGHYFWPLVFS